MNLPTKKTNKVRFYTGVGSRDIPFAVGHMMEEIAYVLAGFNYILRSGGADGSGLAFEAGCDKASGEKRIWRAKQATEEAIEITSRYHGAWHLCSEYARKLHGRNVFQVLGKSLSKPSRFVVCYTHDACIQHEDRSIKTGGTGTTISVASVNDIPVYNLKREDHFILFRRWLKEIAE